MRMSIWGSYENLVYEIFYLLAYTKICTNKNCPLYGMRYINGKSLLYKFVLPAAHVLCPNNRRVLRGCHWNG